MNELVKTITLNDVPSGRSILPKKPFANFVVSRFQLTFQTDADAKRQNPGYLVIAITQGIVCILSPNNQMLHCRFLLS